MINTLVFDFGDIFVNLDKKGAMQNAHDLFGIDTFDADMIAVNMKYEKGLISSHDFLSFYEHKFPNLSKEQIIYSWNYIIKDFPRYRLDYIIKLSEESDYNLILLSNTNTLHMDFIIEHVPFYKVFKDQFDAFYLSHEIHLRKPDKDIFEYVIEQNNLKVKQCLFIDDSKENTEVAKELGFNIWNFNPMTDDIIHLFQTCNELF